MSMGHFEANDSFFRDANIKLKNNFGKQMKHGVNSTLFYLNKSYC